jgi:putative transcriptional regulator
MNSNSNRNPIPGNLLISEPFLQDENFIRSVILLCDHNSEGSFGLVLNKPSILQLSELVEDLDFLEADVFIGGPVQQNTLHFIYFGSKILEGSVQIGEKLWWGGNFDALVEKLRADEIPSHLVRFFLGYSGWGPNQLFEELEQNTWIVCEEDLKPSHLENTPEDLWKILLKNMGGDFRLIANYPLDPRLN